MITAYVHDWNPIILEIGGPLALRWYGLAYLASFVAGFLLLKHLAQKGLWELSADDVSDFIVICAMVGVFIGGRLGYVLFYMIPDEGFSYVFKNPLVIFQVWQGGMASHGGILGLIFVTLYYARKKGVSWPGLGDGLCVVAPLGIFLVRMANFINGELYGRVTQGVTWAIKFPDALFDPRAPEYNNQLAAIDSARQYNPLPEGVTPSSDYIKHTLRKNESLHEVFESLLHARHPSQLYEGLLEGLFLFIILFAVRLKFPKLGYGIITGLFFILYALGRIFCEQYREPDSAMIGALTKGQFYSVFMILIGTAFIIWGATKGKQPIAK